MTHAVYNVLRGKISDALDGARSAGASLAKSAHEILEVAHAEPDGPTAHGTSGRADLIDREVVRVLLTGANLSRIDGMLSAYGAVLRILDDAAAEARAVAVSRVEAEGTRDASTWRQAAAEDPEIEGAEAWALGAFEAWIEDEGEDVFAPLEMREALALYTASLLRALGGAS